MSDERKDGGSAYPAPVAICPSGDVYPAYEGMSLRDWFAGQALCGLLANSGKSSTPEKYAASAYMIGDAMIKAREVQS